MSKVDDGLSKFIVTIMMAIIYPIAGVIFVVVCLAIFVGVIVVAGFIGMMSIIFDNDI